MRSRRGDAPERLEQIVAKALEKNRDERYQTAADLRVDLRRLKREMESRSAPAHEMPSAIGADRLTAAGVSKASTGRLMRRWTIGVTLLVVSVLARA